LTAPEERPVTTFTSTDPEAIAARRLRPQAIGGAAKGSGQHDGEGGADKASRFARWLDGIGSMLGGVIL
jgi:hypothetical protein